MVGAAAAAAAGILELQRLQGAHQEVLLVLELLVVLGFAHKEGQRERERESESEREIA